VKRGCDLLILILILILKKQDQKIAAFGSSYRGCVVSVVQVINRIGEGDVFQAQAD
jgi:hypothetical protein